MQPVMRAGPHDRAQLLPKLESYQGEHPSSPKKLTIQTKIRRNAANQQFESLNFQALAHLEELDQEFSPITPARAFGIRNPVSSGKPIGPMSFRINPIRSDFDSEEKSPQFNPSLASTLKTAALNKLTKP